jgi:hypothetical protein
MVLFPTEGEETSPSAGRRLLDSVQLPVSGPALLLAILPAAGNSFGSKS